MTKTTYKYNSKKQLSEHFNVQEFKCKCGKKHDIVIDSELVEILEKLMKKIGSTYAVVYSGYRCPSHEKEVGGNGGKDYSHSGYAGDMDFYDKKGGKKFDSKTVVLALEDLGWKYGIGYKCGGVQTRTHIDSKHRKWYGDESKSMTASIGDSFYTYLKVNKEVPKTIQSNTSNNSHVYYVVKSGDTLSKIANKYGVKWESIYNLNKTTIDSLAKKHGIKKNYYNYLYLGTKLIIK